MEDGTALRSAYLDACKRNDYEVAHQFLSEIQKHKTFPLFLPKMAVDVSVEEINDYVDLLYPLMTVYLHHGKIDELFKCTSALIDWLHKKPSEIWTDENYRLECNAHYRLIIFYQARDDEVAVQESCLRMVLQGNQIKVKAEDDHRLMLHAYRRLALSRKEWLKPADLCCGELLKLLWKRFDRTKKSFVELCCLVDEISDPGSLRKADPHIDEIFKQYLSFARDHSAKEEAYTQPKTLDKMVELFLSACDKKIWPNAELFLKKIISEQLGINLDSPYEAMDQPDAKLLKAVSAISQMGLLYRYNNKIEEAIPFVEKACQFVLMMRQAPDQLWRNCGMASYGIALSYRDKGDVLTSLKLCHRALSMFECIREKTPHDEDCIVKTQGALRKILRIHAPKKTSNGTVVVSELQKCKQLFDTACVNDNREEAAHALVEMGRCLSVDIFNPDETVDLSDDAILDIIERLNNFAMLPSKDNEALTTLLVVCRWWNKRPNKSSDDWRNYIALLDHISTLYFLKGKFAKCLEIIRDMVKAYENIQSEENEIDIDIMINRCQDAVECCLARKDVEQKHEWDQKYNQFCSVLVEKIKADLQRLLIMCDKSSAKKNWDSVENAVGDAQERLCRLDEIGAEAEYADAQRYQFALRLYGVFEANHQNVFGCVRELVSGMRVRSDEAESLLIKCNVGEKALKFKSEKKCKMNIAFGLAEKTLSQEDKQKIREIEARRKAKEETEKTARLQKRQEERKEKERKRQEVQLKTAEKEAEAKKNAEKDKQYQIEKAKFVGLYRKFGSLSIAEVEKFYFCFRKLSSKVLNLNRKYYIEGSAQALSRQRFVDACEQLMSACESVFSCYLKSCCDNYENATYEELISLNAIFLRAWNLYNRATEWEDLVGQVKKCEKEFKAFHIFRGRVSRSVVSSIEIPQAPIPSLSSPVIAISEMPAALNIKRYRFFSVKDKPPHELSENLMQSCEVWLNNLVQARRASDAILFQAAEEKLRNICEELLKRYPGFEDILDNESHEHYEIMSLLDSCRVKDAKVRRAVNPMPSSQRIKEMCQKFQDRIEEVERLRRTYSL